MTMAPADICYPLIPITHYLDHMHNSVNKWLSLKKGQKEGDCLEMPAFAPDGASQYEVFSPIWAMWGIPAFWHHLSISGGRSWCFLGKAQCWAWVAAVKLLFFNVKQTEGRLTTFKFWETNNTINSAGIRGLQILVITKKSSVEKLPVLPGVGTVCWDLLYNENNKTLSRQLATLHFLLLRGCE